MSSSARGAVFNISLNRGDVSPDAADLARVSGGVGAGWPGWCATEGGEGEVGAFSCFDLWAGSGLPE